ncbi:FAD:protein FMN transferase [soil metagenome]
MKQGSFQAMGTTVEAWFDAVDRTAALARWFERVEGRCSRFRPDNELSRINRDPALESRTSAMMWQVLSAADRARTLTEGLVDIGVGSAVASWGYDRTFAGVTDIASPRRQFDVGGWSLSPGDRAIQRQSGTALDLGGIAKGWACDRAVETGLARVVSAGGDIRSADPGTVTTVMDNRDGISARVHVGVGALATSSTTRRRWRVGGREVSHLVDPRTMKPVETPVLSATVVASTAVEAEVGAKAVLIKGAGGLAWADTTDWIRSALVLWHDGSVFATTGTELVA